MVLDQRDEHRVEAELLSLLEIEIDILAFEFDHERPGSVTEDEKRLTVGSEEGTRTL